MHRGEWLHEKIRTSAFTFDHVAAELDQHRTTLFRHLKNPDLPYRIMNRIAKVIKITLPDEIEEEDFDIDEGEIDYKEKYILLLEEFVKLQTMYNDLVLSRSDTADSSG